ncbi:MAG: hypothetical protein JW739_02155 [Opitutales bacterium]|nr:hypothetical protein [Opitutales bacterium]
MNTGQKSETGRILLLLASVAVGAIALLHVAIIIGGASWYRAFGAGEKMASLAESGSLVPALSTIPLVLIFALWSLYAYAAATGRLRLPFMRFVLCAIAAIFLLRGFSGIPVYFSNTQAYTSFFIISTSLASFIIGLLYFLGTFFRRSELK